MSASPDAYEEQFVITRSGDREELRYDRITDRNKLLTSSVFGGRDLAYVRKRLPGVTRDVVIRFQNGMTTHDLDMVTAEILASRATHHPDYSDLAARILISDHQKSTPDTFLGAVERIAEANPRRFSAEFLAVVRRPGVAAAIDERIDHTRDFLLDYFGFLTAKRSYLFRETDRDSPTVERPQYAHMRVALQLCVLRGASGNAAELPEAEFNECLERAFRVYDLMSTQKLSHASPTVFNSGTARPQLASCFLMAVDDDLRVLANVVRDLILISAAAGGIGLSLDPMRAEGSLIKSTGGQSTGIRMYVNLLDAARQYANQGNLRPGALAVSLGPDHADIFTFLEMGRLTDYGTVNTPDLKFALYVSDLFMEATVAELREAVKPEAERDPAAGDWHLFSPDEAPGLYSSYGEKYRALHAQYVREKRYRSVVKASDIWKAWLETVRQRGAPYVLFKDHLNHKSNLTIDEEGEQRTCTHSNLCAEITIPAVNKEGDPDNAMYGTCNLGAVPLLKFVVADVRGPAGVRLDWAGIADTAGEIAENLDNLIDSNYYPVEPCRRSNNAFRPIAIGVIGVQNVLHAFRYAYGSPEALALDQAIRAAIYYGAMRRSVALGKSRGNYPKFAGSRAQRGQIQPDLWVEHGHLDAGWAARVEATTGGFLTPAMWDALREDAKVHLRNGYVTAEMPTATTSQFLGQNECGEPLTSNAYTRSTLAGEVTMLSRDLQRELTALGHWNDATRRNLIAAGGSVQAMDYLPKELRFRYRTAREIPQESLIDHAAACGPFLSQTRSQNLYFDKLTLRGVLTALIRAWRLGNTTGVYYTHTSAARGTAAAGAVAAAAPAEPEAGGGGAKPAPAGPAQFDFADFSAFGGTKNGVGCVSCAM